MSSTLLRYYLKRWSLPLLGALFFYGGLILANELVRASREIFSQQASFRWLLPILLTTLPETLAMVLPMAGVLGGMLGTQYLSEGSEMVASQGLGVGMRSILKPWLILSGIVLALATANAHWMVPQVAVLQNRIKAQMLEDTKLRHIKPGAPPYSFRESDGADACIWVSMDGQVHLMEASPKGVQHVVARKMNWYSDPDLFKNAALVIEFEDLSGCTIQGSDHSVVHIQEKTQRLRIPTPSAPTILPPTPLRFLPTQALVSVSSASAWIELGRRLTLPISAVALLLLGIGLGLGHPRFHKGGAIVKSLGVILIYYILMRLFESRVNDHFKSLIPLLLLPFTFLGAGFILLARRMKPHRSNRFSLLAWFQKLCVRPAQAFCLQQLQRLDTVGQVRSEASKTAGNVLGRWTRRLWIRQWAGVLGSFLVLNLLMEFAAIAGDISKNHISYRIFFYYWAMNLPSFLVIVLPIAFLLAGTLAFSDAAQSREWVAIRAGGVSLFQWIRAGFGAWAAILLLTLFIESFLAPRVARKADMLYRQILNRPVATYQSKPWLFLGPRNIIWRVNGTEWWGFPLQRPSGGQPTLLRWESGTTHTEALAWDGLRLVNGPEASSLFPEGDLMGSGRLEETTTLKLFLWEKWSPDPERATIIWGRFLNWLAGPALIFALMSFAFPAPRDGRGKAIGYCLVGGLLFIGLQGIFVGAARSGELPAVWGILAPLLLLAGIGLLRLNRLRT